MTLPMLVFFAALAVLGGMATVIGSRTVRRIALMYVAAATATYLAGGEGFHQIQLVLLSIDLALLLGISWTAITTTEQWPIVSAALQLLTTLAHAARISDVSIHPLAYAVMAQWTSWPSLVVLAIGIYRHRRTAGGT